MKRISTHVLDVATGKPAARLAVRLERSTGSGEWTLLAASHTDSDGRCAQLLPENATLDPGMYRLTFDTAKYQATNHIEPLYPFIEITFHVRDGDSHFHLPLLLSPYGYTTYRGS